MNDDELTDGAAGLPARPQPPSPEDQLFTAMVDFGHYNVARGLLGSIGCRELSLAEIDQISKANTHMMAAMKIRLREVTALRGSGDALLLDHLGRMIR